MAMSQVSKIPYEQLRKNDIILKWAAGDVALAKDKLEQINSKVQAGHAEPELYAELANQLEGKRNAKLYSKQDEYIDILHSSRKSIFQQGSLFGIFPTYLLQY
jgi:hypothetical protein